MITVRLSLGFIALVAGSVLTFCGYLGAPGWLAWPATLFLEAAERSFAMSERMLAVRVFVLILAVALNVGVIAGVLVTVCRILQRLAAATKRRPAA